MTTWTALLLSALSAAMPSQDAPRTPIEPLLESPAAQQRVADAQAPRSIVIHDCSDLRRRPGISSADIASERDQDDFETQLERKRLALLERSIREHVRPSFLPGIDRLEVHGGTTFVVTGTAEQHAWIRRFLELQREEDASFLSITTHRVRAAAERLEALGFEGPSQVIADASDAHAAVRRLETAFTAEERIGSPRFLIGQGTPAYISTTKDISYVKSYDVVYVHPGPTAIADPVVDVIQEGEQYEIAGTQIEPGLWVLEVELERTEVERPIPTEEVELTIDGPAVTIGKPSVQTSKLSTTVLLRDGGAVWFRAPDGDEELLVLVRMEVVPASTAAKRAEWSTHQANEAREAPREREPDGSGTRFGAAPADDDED